ncbi:hypothetical protein PMAYCL1PPCAC_08245, partial [Pristionchus mayeri]
IHRLDDEMDDESATNWSVDVATEAYSNRFSVLDLRFFGATIPGATVIITISVLLCVLVIAAIVGCLSYWWWFVREDEEENERIPAEQGDLLEKVWKKAEENETNV